MSKVVNKTAYGLGKRAFKVCKVECDPMADELFLQLLSKHMDQPLTPMMLSYIDGFNDLKIKQEQKEKVVNINTRR